MPARKQTIREILFALRLKLDKVVEDVEEGKAADVSTARVVRRRGRKLKEVLCRRPEGDV